MSAIDAALEDRAKLSFDFDDEEDEGETKEAVSRKIEEISAQSGFTARAPVPRVLAKESVPARKKAAPVRDRRRRAKTGRTYPFNTKIKPETYDAICALADKATAEEGRPVSLAEIIERAVEALQAR